MPPRHENPRFASYLIALSLTLAGALAKRGLAAESELVETQHGNCPVILTAPHGGTSEVPGVDVRRGEDVAKFKTVRDTRTDELTELAAKELEHQGYGKPFVVIAKFHRRYIDANRPADGAFESNAAKQHYDAYHNAIRSARRDIIERWGRGVLLDFHGTAAESSTIFRGTQNGKTVLHLTNRFGLEALRGPKSLFGQFAANGISVAPTVGSVQLENPRLNGGFTVRTYGSSDGGTFDAIQLELGAKLRAKSQIDETAKRIASSIKSFAKDYLSVTQIDRRAKAKNQLGLLIPAYSYPAGDGLKFWNALIDAADRVPMIVIANPNSGPGMRQDPNYKTVIERVQRAGANVVGYAPTGYAKRDANKVQQDIDRWKEFYPSIDGVFLDEQSSDASDVSHYASVSKYTRTKIADALIVSNPGTVCAKAYRQNKVFDVICVFESAKGLDSFVTPNADGIPDATDFAALLHSQQDANIAIDHIRNAKNKGIRYIYVTDDVMPNPWDLLPSFWNEELATIEQINKQVERN